MVKNLLITGYKSHELGIFKEKDPGVHYIKKAIEKQLTVLLEEGLEWVIISGQPGVEIWAGEVAVELRDQRFPDLKLAVLTPFLDQEANWNEARQEQYHELLAQADFVESISNKPYFSPKQLAAKNGFLVQKTDGMLILYDEDTPGTPRFYLEPARRRQEKDPAYEVLYITPSDLELIYQDEQDAKGEFWE
ncbi:MULTISPECIES: DUF1273 domain-containing protein [Fictibacillus]|uniref:DUF1273 domain-containing protein n=1 Tax=Fictibacillus TaxID=1329200 RepID=UPI0008F33A51|nr:MULTISPECIES: DUF1273 domain-containing protein [Fictibacillus]SFD75390.1 Uncharacterized SPBc2 prophage-derived protein YoqJ [Bacillus sp. OV194]